MKNTLVYKIAFLTLALALCTTSAMAGADAFNRAKLGGSWVPVSGSFALSNHELIGSTLALAYSTSSTGNSAGTVVVSLGSTDLEYGAVALGNIAGGNNAFVKIQAQNGAGTFDHGAFYTGNNGTGTFFALSSPVPSPAVLDVFFCGPVAFMRITSAAGTQVYSNNYGGTFGKGVGLGTYGSVLLDNYIGFASSCSAAQQTAIPAAMMPAAKDLSK
jgi:hypothetical protein